MKAAAPAPTASILMRSVAALLAVCLAAAPVPLPAQGDSATGTAQTTKKSTSKKSTAAKPAAKSTAKKSATRKSTASPKSRRRAAARRKRRPSAEALRIKRAFVVSAELRPMAQQLMTLRTQAAYDGVAAYAKRHTGDAAATAYLALGNAYLLDKRYTDAAASFAQAHRAGNALDDYAEFLGASANHQGGNDQAAEQLLRSFTTRHPGSVFDAETPELEASILLGLKDAAGAQRVLAAADASSTGRPGFLLVRAQTAEALNQNADAMRIYKDLLLRSPLTQQAVVARARLTASGEIAKLSVAEERSLADAFYRAGRYVQASEQYHALAQNSSVSADARADFEVAAAACDWKLKRLTVADAQVLPDSDDENGARRSYLLMELARDRNDLDTQQSVVRQMQVRFPKSNWLAEALFSSGNMYLLRRDYPKAIEYYTDLARRFPNAKNASPAHWRAGWLSYRLGLYSDAAKLFDEQINLYPRETDTVSALYWRGRLYETQEHNPARASANYRAIVRAYPHFFYAQMARQRLAALGSPAPAEDATLDQFQAADAPDLDDSFPEDSEHLAKARLLANAGMNEYIPREIAADPDSANWSALAEAEIYASYGETFRAMRALKRALPSAASSSIKSIPLAYWRILFPEPYWSTIKAESAKNNLDPYLVAALIRQESEFNPSVVSYANAWGLMQLITPVGKEMARAEGLRNFQTYQLLDPETIIRLGTRYLRQMLDSVGGVPEYALAAYNAGDSRVKDWKANGPYSGMDEFVESIPFTQTREYVQGILRNIEIYKAIDAAAASSGARSASGR